MDRVHQCVGQTLCLGIGSAVGSSLLYEETRTLDFVVIFHPHMHARTHAHTHTHTHTHTHIHTHSQTQEAILILYSFTILSLRRLFPSSSTRQGGGVCDFIDTGCVAVALVVRYVQQVLSSLSSILW